MALHAVWVHGHAVVPERAGGATITSPGPLANVEGVPWTDVLGLRQGWGATFRGKANEEVWFHASIPTPVVVGSSRARLQRVFILFRLFEPEARINAVNLWDGPNLIGETARWDFGAQNAGLYGDRSNDIYYGTNRDNANSCELRTPHEMRFGLGVSVKVTFGPTEGNVLFTTLGADFEV